MTTLLVVKQYIKNFISKYEVYLKPLMKLILALASLMMINSKIGYMHRLDNISIVLIVALMCSFMPMNFIIFVAAVFTVLHLYALSLECAAIALVLFLVLFLLYFRFSPKDTLVVLLTPMCFVLKIPYAVPLTMGLIGTPASAISVGCGVIVSYLISYIADSATALSGMDTEDIITKVRYIVDGLLNNKEMLLTIFAFAVTIVIVYLIKRMSINYAWTIAMIAGAIVDVMILLVGDLMFDTNVSIIGIIIGTVFSMLIAKVVEFFAFHVDYSRVEKVQFEDDEYYYYVKAVPKITVATPSKTVKRINTPKKRYSGGQSRR
ncbi:MAG: hypothetical protein ACI4EP_01530 [Suilimivivens sp.]|nr:hypothetical protein [Lachnospiraceae bacterium]MDY5869490.1 hypothetical protein [Lachnospiraceae bacterium]